MLWRAWIGCGIGLTSVRLKPRLLTKKRTADMDLTINYEIITGTPDALAKLANSLKKTNQPFQWVNLTKTNPHEWNAATIALKISRELFQVLMGCIRGEL